MANIGDKKRIYEVPEPAQVPDTVPSDLPISEPEKVPVGV